MNELPVSLFNFMFTPVGSFATSECEQEPNQNQNGAVRDLFPLGVHQMTPSSSAKHPKMQVWCIHTSYINNYGDLITCWAAFSRNRLIDFTQN